MNELVLALLKSGDGASKKGSVHPLRKRFHAWWEGYDLPDPPEEEGAGSADGASQPGGGFPPDDGTVPESADEWTDERIKVVQMLWGAGFSKPGDLEYVLDLAKPFGLTKENTMLELGAGLGGSGRGIVEKFGAYIDGYELNAELVAKANEISKIKDLDKKVSVRDLDPAMLDFKTKYYDGCLVRETLMEIEDKEAVLDAVLQALKPGTSIVISDFFIPSPEPGDTLVEAMEAERRLLFPCTVDRIVEMLEARALDIRVNKDETDRHENVIRAAWGEVAALIERKPVDEALSRVLMAEMDKWALRNAAYEAGELRMQRIVAFKTSGAR